MPGYLGKPVNDRWYSNEELAEVMHKTVTYAKQMDRLGYNTFWMAEHHFQPEGTECIPNLLMMATHLCGVTKTPQHWLRLQHRADVASARLAEDYAMADILTGGRVIFGIGRGYHTREVETFGAPCSIRPPTASCSRKASTSSTRPSTRSASATRANTTRCRPKCRTAAIR